MSGLVEYESSEEYDDSPDQISKHKATEAHNVDTQVKSLSPVKLTRKIANDIRTRNGEAYQKPIVHAQSHGDEQAVRPLEGPSAPNFELEPVVSLYSDNRALIRDLTLPAIPNLDIPESPPGSPPLGLGKKLQQFDRLKVQGVHFNEKLANSSALKNPSLTIKLIQAAGMDEQEQYASALPKDIWDPTGFPLWAYKEHLAKAQKQREEQWMQSRNRVDFISATSSGNPSKTGTPGDKRSKVSAAERVLSSLDGQ